MDGPPENVTPGGALTKETAALMHLGGFKDVLALVGRERFLIASIAVVVMAIAAIGILRLTPTFTAETFLLIDTRKTDVVDLRAVMGGLQPEANAIRSELDVLHSRDLAAKVIEKLGLTGDPVFTRDISIEPKPTLIERLPAVVQSKILILADALGIDVPRTIEFSQSEQRERFQSALITKMLDKLNVSSDGRSNTIHLTFTSESPSVAASVVNAVAETYLTDQLDAKFDATRRANQWLSERLADLKLSVERSENAVAAYRAQKGLTQTNAAGVTVTTAQLAEISTALVTAQADRAQKEGKLRSVQGSLKHGLNGATATEVLQSPLINQLRGQEASLSARLADLRAHYGEKYPAVIQGKAELSDVEGKINGEINKIIGSLTQEVDAARQREMSLQTQLSELQRKSSRNSEAEVGLKELERDALTNRQLYDQFLTRFKETSEQVDLQQPDARVIAKADVPLQPSFPNTKLFLVVALICSVMLGIGVAILRERFDKGFRSADQVEAVTGHYCIGMIPNVTGLFNSTDKAMRNQDTMLSSAVQNVLTNLIFAGRTSPKVVLVTSAVPEEGKSLTAQAIATTSAQMGRKTLLIDCDLRKPTVLQALGGRKDATLVELLAGELDMDAVCNVDRQTGLNYIVARAKNIPNPHTVLGNSRFSDMLGRLREHYDLVVLDSPPVFAAADTSMLSRLADTTVFVVRWEKTVRGTVLRAMHQLKKVNANIGGVVLTRVNLKKHARYGYNDQAGYYGKYGKYGSRA